MTHGRFVAVVPLRGRPIPAADPSCGGSDEVLATLAEGSCRVARSAGLPALSGPRGIVLGLLYDRGQRRPAERLADDGWAGIAASRGALLVDRYWGSFVALLAHDGEVAVVRSPFADLGCFYCLTEDALFVASDLPSLLRAARHPRTIAAERVLRHIAWPDWPARETCLEGIAELRGGERLTAAAGEVRIESIWSPWAFVSPERQIDDAVEARRRLRDAVELAVAARSAPCRRPLLLLSGGLDSSVVASSLRSAGAEFACLNLVADDAGSDETAYARCVAKAVSAELRIERLATDHVDVNRSGAAHLPYPVHRGFTQAQDRIAQDVAGAFGADAVFDGGGGDNVFFASRSVSMLADCLLTGGFDRRFWAAAAALGDLAQAGLPRLVGLAVYRAWWRARVPRHPPAEAFLDPALKGEVRRTPPHPWLDPPPSVLPGRAAHVGLLVPAQKMVEAVNAGAPYRAISPLASQPVIEACLRIPSGLWIAQGHDRAVVRSAYEGRLPAPIVHRRSKGTPTTFVAQVFERNRPRIRDMLLGGWLAEQRIIDTAALARALADEAPVRDLSFAQLMSLVDVEAWARAQR